MTASIQDKVIKILAEQALIAPSEVGLDATLENLGIDSLGLVESVFAIEETFDVQVPFNANAPMDNDFDISSVRAIVASVQALVTARH